MIPQNKTNQNFRKDLLKGSSEPKRSQIYRTGKVANSGASLQPPRLIKGEAGREESERAQMMGALSELLGGKGGVIPQYIEAEKERGIAEWDKATFEQREKWGVSVRNGWVNEKNDPYWREEITKQYTSNLIHKYGQDLFTDYEKWEGKNDESSGALTAWFDQQDEKFAINLESIPDTILAKHFYEQQQALKRQITQRHTEHLNKEYRDKSYNTEETGFFNMFSENSSAISEDLKDPNSSIAGLLKEQRPTEQEYRELSRLVTGISNDEAQISKRSLDELGEKATLKGGVWAWAYGRLTGDFSGDTNIVADKNVPTPVRDIDEKEQYYAGDKDADEAEIRAGEQFAEFTGVVAKSQDDKPFTIVDVVESAAITVQKARGKDVMTVDLKGDALQKELKKDKTALNLGTSGLIRPGDGTNKLLERMFDGDTGLIKIPQDTKDQLELEKWLALRGSDDRKYQESIFQKYMEEKYPKITKGSGDKIRIVGKWKKASLSTLDFIEYYNKQGT